ncbi:MAG: DUF3343 domain-containing protein [Clostridia bacterium]|nr:DUF3343 domain-containing protein [Clostridia bacterium]MBQ7788143.1 DUF3343 domain-containing protein [Clostridia bacterium]
MTYALKAKKALTENYIDSEIIKLEPYMSKKGCSYGIRFDCVNLYAVESVFKRKSVKYTEIINI